MASVSLVSMSNIFFSRCYNTRIISFKEHQVLYNRAQSHRKEFKKGFLKFFHLFLQLQGKFIVIILFNLLLPVRKKFITVLRCSLFLFSSSSGLASCVPITHSIPAARGFNCVDIDTLIILSYIRWLFQLLPTTCLVLVRLKNHFFGMLRFKSENINVCSLFLQNAATSKMFCFRKKCLAPLIKAVALESINHIEWCPYLFEDINTA